MLNETGQIGIYIKDINKHTPLPPTVGKRVGQSQIDLSDTFQ